MIYLLHLIFNCTFLLISPFFDKIAWIEYKTNEIAIFDLNSSQIKYLIPYQETDKDDDNFFASGDNNNHLTFCSNGKILSVTNSNYNNVYIINSDIGEVLKIVDLEPLYSKPPVVLSQNGKVLIAQSSSLPGSLLLDIEKEKIISFISDDSSFGSPTISYCSDLSGKIIVKGGLCEGIEVLKYLKIEDLNRDLSKKTQVIDDLLIVANFYFNKQEYEEAKRIYTEAISLDQNNFELYLKRGKCSSLQGDFINADNDISISIKLNDKNAESYFWYSLILSDKGEAEGVIQYLSIVLEMDSTFYSNEYLFYLRACAYHDLGLIDKALNDLNVSLNLNQGYIDALLLKGRISLRVRDYDNTVSCMNQILDKDQYNYSAYTIRGLAYYDLGNKFNAVEDLKKMDINNKEFDSDKVLWIRACAYFDIGNADEAIKDLNVALTINPHLSEALYSRGFILQSLGNYQQAIEDYTRCLQINPENYLAYNQRSSARSAIGDHEGALNDLYKVRFLSQK